MNGGHLVLLVLFWVSVACILHSYLFYPLLLDLAFRRKNKSGNPVADKNETLPFVSVLLAVHNEEKVIEQKISSTLASSYPADKMEWLIGSDQSKDRTDTLINAYAALYPHIRLIRFDQRRGKVLIINELAHKAKGEILILTDANVFFSPDTIYELVRNFSDPSVALVAGNIINPDVSDHGISRQESSYLFMENRMKYKEGVVWGAMMGAFGGCYAIRKNYFKPTPDTFIVDDFYITMSVLEQGGKAIAALQATCYEDVSNKIKEEFRRKTRIATGNFQNMRRFAALLAPSKGGVAFAFFSHKVLRWLGPFFLIASYLCSFALSFDSSFYRACFWIQTALLLIPLLDALLQKLNIHFYGLRYVSHFYAMNLALLNGFFKYLTGVKHNVWTPTERNQS